MSRSYYLQASFALRMLYKTVSVFFDKSTLEKIVLDGSNAPQSMLKNFHPCQLE